MWKNFLQSLGLLGIAMVAALYSSSASNEGRGVAAGIAALISLTLALWVGFRFVPRLAKSVDWNWIPFLSSYKVTNDGWIFLVTIFIVVFAAINTSNNLLYMVLSALLAVLLLSGFLSSLNLKHLETELRIPSQCFAGETFPASVRLRNHRRVFPMFSVRIEPARHSALPFQSLYFDAIAPRSEATRTSETILARRGRYPLQEVRAVSRFPFGLLSKSLAVDVDAEILCYPEILPREQLNMASLDVQGETQRAERGSGHDLHTIRDYLSSDGARHVHWKASAKTGALKTREYAADESPRVILALDRYGTPEDRERFEHLVSQAASLAFHLIREGTEVTFISDTWRFTEGSAGIRLNSILEFLATVEMSADAGMPDIGSGLSRQGSLLLSLRTRHG